jgi:hypothetical protein
VYYQRFPQDPYRIKAIVSALLFRYRLSEFSPSPPIYAASAGCFCMVSPYPSPRGVSLDPRLDPTGF